MGRIISPTAQMPHKTCRGNPIPYFLTKPRVAPRLSSSSHRVQHGALGCLEAAARHTTAPRIFQGSTAIGPRAAPGLRCHQAQCGVSGIRGATAGSSAAPQPSGSTCSSQALMVAACLVAFWAVQAATCPAWFLGCTATTNPSMELHAL